MISLNEIITQNNIKKTAVIAKKQKIFGWLPAQDEHAAQPDFLIRFKHNSEPKSKPIPNEVRNFTGLNFVNS
ncbi:MAG: hypothetical protein ABIH19_04595 [Candidatus Omnitrophota bacterium]